VEFKCIDASKLNESISERFDYTIACMCLHVMDPDIRKASVRDCLLISQKMIIADYKAPSPRSIIGLGNEVMEMCAGKRHYRNFKDWQVHGGIDGLTQEMKLKRVYENQWADRAGAIIIVSK
jgi:hypothetical protein